MPVVVKKDDGFWVMTDDVKGDKAFYPYKLNEPLRQPLTIEQQLNSKRQMSRTLKFEVCYF